MKIDDAIDNLLHPQGADQSDLGNSINAAYRSLKCWKEFPKQVAEAKRRLKDENPTYSYDIRNPEYFKGYMVAMSTVEGMIAAAFEEIER